MVGDATEQTGQRNLTVTMDLTMAEAIALRKLVQRLLSRTIEETLADLAEIKAADEARNKLSTAIFFAMQES